MFFYCYDTECEPSGHSLPEGSGLPVNERMKERLTPMGISFNRIPKEGEQTETRHRIGERLHTFATFTGNCPDSQVGESLKLILCTTCLSQHVATKISFFSECCSIVSRFFAYKFRKRNQKDEITFGSYLVLFSRTSKKRPFHRQISKRSRILTNYKDSGLRKEIFVIYIVFFQN